jgi:hypothetical protein
MSSLDYMDLDIIITRYIKRFLDVVLSGLAILVLSHVLIAIIILELVFHGRPVFYMDKRPGKNREIFEMYYLGWDIAVTESGIELVEANFGHASVVFQLDHVGKYALVKKLLAR